MRKQTRRKSKSVEKIQHREVNKLSGSARKVKYCPIVSQMLKQKNNRKLKKPIVSTLLDYLNTFEQLYVRSVCKQWNDVIKDKLEFLRNENFIFQRKRLPLYNNSSNKKCTQIFENSDKKFSKRRVLVKLITSKNFSLIKNKIALGEITKSKNLKQD